MNDIKSPSSNEINELKTPSDTENNSFDPDKRIDVDQKENTGDKKDNSGYDVDKRVDVAEKEVTGGSYSEVKKNSNGETHEVHQVISSTEHMESSGDSVTTEKTSKHQEEIEGKKHYYDDNGNLYRIDNDLVSNGNYEINGYKYETDDNGRIISAEGTLHLKDHDGRLTIKDSIEDIGKGDQKEGDDRGHLIGDQFDGSNGLENMIPQDADINQKDFRLFENELAKCVKESKEVTIKVEPIYDADSRRPSAVVVTYAIDGEESVRIFPNEKESK